MDEDILSISIRPAEEDEVAVLQAIFSPNDFAGHHAQRFSVQAEGKGVYLVAWHEGEPVGHFLLHWEGPETDTSEHYPYPTPYLEAGGTKAAYRRRGVATGLIRAAEALVRDRGIASIGLAVGSSDNPDARRIYTRLGYRDWGKGEFLVSWGIRNAGGEEGIDSEVCIYMFKQL